ncbi:uncharacterized protein LOC115164901 isoform X2 [Salmo trutta]|nr:uncharacterized protein LOC115164901 isoform X2 [Salmo trutta]
MMSLPWRENNCGEPVQLKDSGNTENDVMLTQKEGQYLEKEREKWRKDKETGKKKAIAELSDRVQGAERKKWRDSKRILRARVKTSALLQSAELKEATLGDPAASNQLPTSHDEADTTWRPGTIELNHVGEWCVVNYDHEGYPGIIIDVGEHNIKVKCMHRNGINKFFWPSPKEDICWYSDGQIICQMPEPWAVNKHSVQMEKSTWKYVEEHLG